MSQYASAIRNKDDIVSLLEKTDNRLKELSLARAGNKGRIWLLMEYRNALLTQKVYLAAMLDYAENYGKSRGSSLYSSSSGAVHPQKLDERFFYSLEKNEDVSLIQETQYSKDGKVSIFWREPIPIPEVDDFFERVWAEYRKNGNVF
jgi:succinate dehydrogenase / fumarate reductase flavoprotein subunit